MAPGSARGAETNNIHALKPNRLMMGREGAIEEVYLTSGGQDRNRKMKASTERKEKSIEREIMIILWKT